MMYMFSSTQFKRRQSLLPPRRKDVTWKEYINATPGKPPCLGRSMIAKESSKTFKATVAMVMIYLLLFRNVSFTSYLVFCIEMKKAN